MLLLLGCDQSLLAGLSHGQASPPEPSAMVWQGFHQSWTYNHRLNAMGDFATPVACDDVECTFELGHTAASGSGSDTATFESSYTTVFADDVVFSHGMSACELDAAAGEGEPFSCRLQGVAEVPKGAAVAVLLDGFEVRATDDADKLQRLAVSVGTPQVNGTSATFDVRVGGLFDCDSLECDGTDKLDASLRYSIDVRWLVVAGPFVATSDRSEETFAWDVERELDVDSFARSTEIPVENTAFVGITAFDVLLDDDHHMAEWATRVEQGPPAGGRLPVTTTAVFKQWNATTLQSPLSYLEPGLGSFVLETSVVELDGCVVPDTWEDRLEWAADGGPSDGDATVYTMRTVESCD